MKRILLVAVIAFVAIGAAFALQGGPNRGAAADCGDWADATSDRVATARQLLYPAERQEQSTGSVQGDADALYQIAQEQANSDPPDEAVNLNGDLIEAFSAGSTALSGGGGGSPEAQITFAKAIVYNADLRIAYLQDNC